MKKEVLLHFFLACTISLIAVTSVAQKSEARLLWVSRWMYSNENDVRAIVRNAKATGFNILLFQVRGNATAFYKSSYEPTDDSIGGDTATWDPLAIAVDESKKQGIQLHAWVNVYPAWRGKNPPKSSKQLWNIHPDWFCVDKDGKPMGLNDDYEVLSPGIPAVQDHLFNVFMDIVNHYDIDGLHFDYVRYFGSDYSYDSISLTRFQEQYHATPTENPKVWNDFRRQQVTNLVRRTYLSIKKTKPHVALSAAVWGDWEEGRNEYFQDSHGWLAQGIIDFICPMSYTPDANIYENYTKAHMMNTHGRYIYSGLGIYLMKSPDIMLKEMEINRKYPNIDGTVGYTSFDWSALYNQDSTGTLIPTKFQNTLVEGPFKEPTLVPGMWWKKSLREDVVGPYITNLRTEPTIIRQGDSFRIHANVTDSSGLAEEIQSKKNVTMIHMKEPFTPNLLWDDKDGLLVGLNKPPVDLIGMKPTSNENQYITESLIKAHNAGEPFYYKIAAADNIGNVNDSELAQVYIYYPSSLFVSKGEFGPSYQTGQFATFDKKNRIWICEVRSNSLRIINPDGSESSISKITTGLDENKNIITLRNPSGLATDNSGMVYATFGSWSDGYLSKYNPENGTPMWGMHLKYAPGDIAIDKKGDLFITEKLKGLWHLYDSNGKEYAGSPFSHNTVESGYISRGITVTPDGRTVYIASESAGEILKFTGFVSEHKASYKQRNSLAAISGAAGAVDLDKQGNIYVSDYGKNCISIFNKNEKHIADIVGGSPELRNPRGVLLSQDGKNMYIVVMDSGHGLGRLQKWAKEK